METRTTVNALKLDVLKDETLAQAIQEARKARLAGNVQTQEAATKIAMATLLKMHKLRKQIVLDIIAQD